MKKIYIIYDERANTMELSDCAVLLVTENKKEALLFAKENNGVVEENDLDGDIAINGKIIK